MTLSIVARDPVTGELGVAVQTAYFAVGRSVPWVRPAVGAVASQAITEPAHGPAVLDRLAAGADATSAMAEVLEDDPHREIRQLGVVDAAGNVATHTGSGCLRQAGHVAGAGVSVQCNLAASDGSWGQMLEAFESADGTLADRMLAALGAGQRAGGDARGRQSAALTVVSGDGDDPPWKKTIDLRVDDHSFPVEELRRLMGVHRAYALMGEGIDLLFQGQVHESIGELRAARALRPDDPQALFWEAAALEAMGQAERAAQLFEQSQDMEPGWRPVREQMTGWVRSRGLSDRPCVAAPVTRSGCTEGPRRR